MPTPIYNRAHLAQNQSNAYLTVNEFNDALEILTGSKVISRSIASPPSGSVDGDLYIVPATAPSGAWTGKENQLAFKLGGAWYFVVPTARIGAKYLESESKLVHWNGTSWTEIVVATTTAEFIQDTVAAMFAAGNHTGITFTYRDIDGAIDAAVTGSGGGGSGSDFLAIFGTNLAGWYRSDDLILTSGAVSQWTDKSGKGNHATQSTELNRPAVATGIINGKDVVRFDNQNSWLNLPNGTLQNSWGEASLFIVLRIKDNTQHWDAMRTGSNSTSYWGTNSQFSHAGFFGEFRAARLEQQPANMTVAGNHFIEVISGIETNTYLINRNGANLLTTNPSWGVAETNAYIGRAADSKRMNGDIGEIAIVNRVATNAEIVAVRNYINSYWGL